MLIQLLCCSRMGQDIISRVTAFILGRTLVITTLFVIKDFAVISNLLL